MFNFGEGSPIPQGKEYQFMSGWIPATPGESIPSRSNLMPDDRQNEFGRRNQYGLAPLPKGYEQLQNSVSFCFPFRSGQYFSQIDQQGRNWGSNASSAELQKLIADSSRTLQGRNGSPNTNLLNSWAMNFSASITSPNTTPTRGVSFLGGPSIPDMHYPVNRWGESSPGEQIFNNSTNCSSSSLLSINNSAQRNHYAFSLPWCNNNLNSLPGAAGNAASTGTTTSQFTPVTPNQANKLDNIEHAARTNLSRAKNSGDESGKHQVLAISVIEEANNCSLDDILDNTATKSPAVISIPLEEAKDFDQGSHEVIDLNKTPDQKPPKRKKHRPKVIDENKPKRAPKATTTTTNDSEENRTRKRKYVRKNNIQRLASQHPDSIEHTRNHSAGKRKYVRKKGLNESVILLADPTEAAANQITEKEDYVLKKCLEEPATQHIDSVGMPTQSNSVKRKYAHKLDEDESVNQNRDITIEMTHSSAQTAGKSCRRALNFDLESTTDHWLTAAAQKEEMQNKKRLDLNMGFEATKTNNGVFTMCETVLTSHIGKKNVLPEENQQSEAISKLTTSTNRMPRNHVQCPENQAVTAYLGPTEDIQMNSSNVNARGTNGRLQHQNVEVGQVVFPTKTDHGSIRRIREMMPRNIAQSTLTGGVAPNREYHHIQREKPSPGHSPFLSQIFKVDEHPQHGSISGVGFLGSHKRKRIEEIQTNSFEMPDVPTGRGSRPLTSYATNTNATQTTQERKHEAVNSQHESYNSKTRYNDGCCYPMNNFSKPDLSMERWSCNGRTEETKGTNLVHRVVSSTIIESCRTVRTPKAGPCIQKDQQLSGKGQGTAGRHKFIDPIEQIIYQIESLSINGRSNRIKEEEQNALVPYKRDGSIIPYSGFANINKQKQRAKVNLDPETERVFKLLMGKEGIEGFEGTDKAKDIWWEDERKVFSSRVNSFIARMHLVQGDRRFSKWKGSVVDSVIGVFLTQNVSDHLSSSAFMSLAALFPPQSSTLQNSEIPHKSAKHHRESETGTGETQSQSLEEEVLSSQDSLESSVLQANAGGRSYSSSNLEARQPVNGCKHNIRQRLSFTELLEMDNIVSSDEFHFLTGGSSQSCEASRCGHKLPEDTDNDQQRIMFEGIGSLNYPLALNQIHNPNNPPMQGQAECIPTSNYHLCPNAKFEVPNLQAFKLYNEEKTSWQSNASNFREVKDANCTSKRTILEEAESMGKITSKQCASMRHSETSLKDPNELSSGKSIHAPCHSQLYYDSYLSSGNKTSQLESTSVIKPVNHADEMVERQNYQHQQISNFFRSVEEVFDVEERTTSVARQTCLENNLFESDSKKEVTHTIQANNEAVKNTFKASKAKVKGVEKDAFDWDSLRKQVQENGIKERREDMKDSLDYEELRCASIKRISEAIRERGMNNMLAERIKEFLDRLVSDHGSIDLEWLRDVPPDKAKDYLLSIRGLGLKSVECVRLLTLHHLAFPVDTNVGRIAVRLGWVPLQPLPESLQLHLLELYPILETVQKYLWPRLCKLDQRTLYELHYQMITFGKVFCTKSRPNCNACPMRAECRHFASAFASARLALPGPEEMSITTRTFPSMAARYPGMVINPVMLPLPEANSFKRARSEIDSCVPIVEEPTTPDQQHSQATESDIEDMFDEDPDEIPTIKLNVEEFTVSLQNFMQTSMDLQEGDMSKALVALNPDDSSIPVPKLKNVNRLRTEHQVYELPDSHPLLQGMDRREPDDPSPYLLAIWTPGETANSIEPPKQQCQSHEPDKLCDEKTCSSCNSVREATLQTVRGTLLIPCRTAMRGSFPLNGTYFQVNEVFADHESSVEPINVPRAWIWNLPRRTVYFGTSVPTIFKGLSTGGIQYCFWKGFVCVRGFDQKTRAPRPLKARLHFPASKLAKTKNDKEWKRGHDTAKVQAYNEQNR